MVSEVYVNDIVHVNHITVELSSLLFGVAPVDTDLPPEPQGSPLRASIAREYVLKIYWFLSLLEGRPWSRLLELGRLVEDTFAPCNFGYPLLEHEIRHLVGYPGQRNPDPFAGDSVVTLCGETATSHHAAIVRLAEQAVARVLKTIYSPNFPHNEELRSSPEEIIEALACQVDECGISAIWECLWSRVDLDSKETTFAAQKELELASIYLDLEFTRALTRLGVTDILEATSRVSTAAVGREDPGSNSTNNASSFLASTRDIGRRYTWQGFPENFPEHLLMTGAEAERSVWNDLATILDAGSRVHASAKAFLTYAATPQGFAKTASDLRALDETICRLCFHCDDSHACYFFAGLSEKTGLIVRGFSEATAELLGWFGEQFGDDGYLPDSLPTLPPDTWQRFCQTLALLQSEKGAPTGVSIISEPTDIASASPPCGGKNGHSGVTPLQAVVPPGGNDGEAATKRPPHADGNGTDSEEGLAGVTLLQLALALNEDDLEAAKQTKNRWKHIQKPEPIGKHPTHRQADLYEPVTIVAWAKKNGEPCKPLLESDLYQIAVHPRPV